jgi:hypothetical protein
MRNRVGLSSPNRISSSTTRFSPSRASASRLALTLMSASSSMPAITRRVRVIERRARVHATADPFHLAIDESLRPAGRAFEQHVFQIVGEPQLRLNLVAYTRFDPELKRDDLARTVLLDHHAHPVGKDVSNRR